MTQDEAAAFFKSIIDTRKDFTMLGVIVPIFVETIPDTMLLCDGSTHSKDDFPQLWEVLPSAFKSGSDFTLPDLRERFLLGASGSYPEADTGGSFDVTLDVTQMPSHSHTNFPHSHGEIIAVPALGEISPGVPFPSATPSAGTTSPASITIDNTGGDQPHDNTPPYFAVRYVMIAKVQP